MRRERGEEGGGKRRGGRRERGEEGEGGGGPVGSMRGKDVFQMSATSLF